MKVQISFAGKVFMVVILGIFLFSCNSTSSHRATKEKDRRSAISADIYGSSGLKSILRRCDNEDVFSRYYACVRSKYYSNTRSYKAVGFFHSGETYVDMHQENENLDISITKKLWKDYDFEKYAYSTVEYNKKERSKGSKIAEILARGVVAGLDSYNDSMSKSQSSYSSSNSYSSSSCSSDYSCSFGYKCIKAKYSSTGKCMKPVDKYGMSSATSSNKGNLGINYDDGDCSYSTDCPIGFRCDRKYKVCVKK